MSGFIHVDLGWQIGKSIKSEPWSEQCGGGGIWYGGGNEDIGEQPITRHISPTPPSSARAASTPAPPPAPAPPPTPALLCCAGTQDLLSILSIRYKLHSIATNDFDIFLLARMCNLILTYYIHRFPDIKCCFRFISWRARRHHVVKGKASSSAVRSVGKWKERHYSRSDIIFAKKLMRWRRNARLEIWPVSDKKQCSVCWGLRTIITPQTMSDITEQSPIGVAGRWYFRNLYRIFDI